MPPVYVVMWRCRHCGKFSHAKRRPRLHQRLRELETDPDYRRTVMVWCGPFDRYVAQPCDSRPPAPLHPDFKREIQGTVRMVARRPNVGFDF